MSLNTKELQLIRSLPYPNSEQKNIDGAVMKFAVYLQESKREESLRLIKALQKGIKLGMLLPIYIKKPNKQQGDMVTELLDLQLNPERVEELAKYDKEATEQEKANGVLLIFLDKLYL